MAKRSRLGGFVDAMRSRLTGWLLVAALALLGTQQFGWQRLIWAADLAGHALARAVGLVVSTGWPLLLAAGGLALGLALSGPHGQAPAAGCGQEWSDG